MARDDVSLDNLLKEAKKLDGTIEDAIVPAKAIHVNEDMTVNVGDQENLTMSPWGIHNLCVLAQVPEKYIRRCIETNRWSLVESNINPWLQDDSRDYLVRKYGSNIEGILTSKYKPYNHEQVIGTIRQFVKETDLSYSILNSHMDPLTMHVRMVLNSTETEFRVGDPFAGGLDIFNSEVGKFTFSIAPKLMRLVCTNGMVVTDSTVKFEKFRHVHISELNTADVFNYLGDQIEKMPLAVEATKRIYLDSYKTRLDAPQIFELFEGVRHSISRSFADLVIEFWIDEEKFKVSLEGRITEDTFVTSYEKGKKKPTLGGFWNAVTNVAQKDPDLEVDRQSFAEEYAAFLVMQMMAKTA